MKIADKIAYLGRDIQDASTIGILDKHLDELYEVLNILVANAGTQFDPKVVKYFIIGISKNKKFQESVKLKSKRKIG